MSRLPTIAPVTTGNVTYWTFESTDGTGSTDLGLEFSSQSGAILPPGLDYVKRNAITEWGKTHTSSTTVSTSTGGLTHSAMKSQVKDVVEAALIERFRGGVKLGEMFPADGRPAPDSQAALVSCS